MAVTLTPAPGRGKTRHRTEPRERDGRLAFWLIIPSLCVLTLVIGYPVITSIVRSLFGDGIGKTPFVGFDNYATALWGAGAGDSGGRPDSPTSSPPSRSCWRPSSASRWRW